MCRQWKRPRARLDVRAEGQGEGVKIFGDIWHRYTPEPPTLAPPAAFARLVKRVGIAHCTPHDLRRSCSTLAQRAGVHKYTVKDWGGWSVVSVVERHYTGDVSEAYRRAMTPIAKRAG